MGYLEPAADASGSTDATEWFGEGDRAPHFA